MPRYGGGRKRTLRPPSFFIFFGSFSCHFLTFVLELRYTSGRKWSKVVENGS